MSRRLLSAGRPQRTKSRRIGRPRTPAQGWSGRYTRTMAPVADRRNCVQCGTLFVPRREHARFCSSGCRVAWNRERGGDPAVKVSALQWSTSGMSDTIERLATVNAGDRPQAFALLGEAVWSVTIVDATLVRYHAEVYDAV